MIDAGHPGQHPAAGAFQRLHDLCGYAHLKNLSGSPWYLAALLSWGIAFFEYLLQVPANRIGYTAMTLPQLKIVQETVTLTVFVPFVVFYMRQPLKLDYLWAALCILGAVYFIFREGAGA